MTENPTTLIPHTMVVEAWCNIREFYWLDDSSSLFSELIGVDYHDIVYRYSTHQYNVSVETARRIRLLAGPHWYATLKAYEHTKSEP